MISLALSFLLCLPPMTPVAVPSQASSSLERSVVVDIDLLDVRPDRIEELQTIVRDRNRVIRFLAEGKAKRIANVQLRSKAGQSSTVRSGQRIPLPPMPTTGSASPQIQYENTGFNITATPRLLDSDQVDLKLTIEWTNVARSLNPSAPIFVQRSVNNDVQLRFGETTILLSLAQHDALWPQQPADSTDKSGSSFAILVTARPAN